MAIVPVRRRRSLKSATLAAANSLAPTTHARESSGPVAYDQKRPQRLLMSMKNINVTKNGIAKARNKMKTVSKAIRGDLAKLVDTFETDRARFADDYMAGLVGGREAISGAMKVGDGAALDTAVEEMVKQVQRIASTEKADEMALQRQDKKMQAIKTRIKSLQAEVLDAIANARATIKSMDWEHPAFFLSHRNLYPDPCAVSDNGVTAAIPVEQIHAMQLDFCMYHDGGGEPDEPVRAAVFVEFKRADLTRLKALLASIGAHGFKSLTGDAKRDIFKVYEKCKCVATTHTTQCTNLLAEASLAQRDLDNFVSRMDEEMQALGNSFNYEHRVYTM
jgi:hypothetical protein